MKAQFFLIPAAVLFTTTFNSPQLSERSEAKLNKASATLDPDFTFFRTHRQGKGVTATWGVSSINGVVGFIVQRTYEDPTDPYAFWEDISSTPCNPSRSFKCTDDFVFPGYINYRVVAMIAVGGSIVSPVSTVRVVGH